MSSYFVPVLTGVLLVTGAIQARAELQPLQQTRRVEASAEREAPPDGFNVSDAENAADFSQWLAAASAAPALDAGHAEALASQNSSVAPLSLRAVGSIRAGGSAITGGRLAARSLYRVQFAVTEATPFVITGLLARSTRTPVLSVTLDRVAGPRVFEAALASLELEQPVSGVGTLSPAAYELTVSASLDVEVFSDAEFTREAAFVVELVASEGGGLPSDLDDDGDVDLVDFQIMQNSFTGPVVE